MSLLGSLEQVLSDLINHLIESSLDVVSLSAPFDEKCLANKKNDLELIILCELTFNCSKSTLQTLEKGMKYVQSWQ